jgi:hypothetical protein
MLRTKRKTTTVATSREAVAAIRAQISRGFGVTIDAELLDGDELHELAMLTRKVLDGAEDNGTRVPLATLPKSERSKWERLVGIAAGDPDLFKNARSEQAARARISELVERARRPTARQRFEEQGAIILPAEVFTQLRLGQLWLGHLAVLAHVVGQLENGVSLAPRSRVEDGVLIVSDVYGLAGERQDGDGRFDGWRPLLAHLAQNGWLKAERAGNEWRIGLGPRMLRAFELRGAAR